MLTHSKSSFLLVGVALLVTLFVGGMAAAPLLGLPQVVGGLALAALGVRVAVMVWAVREPTDAPEAASVRAGHGAPRLHAA